MAPQAAVNWATYNSLPPEEAEYQLAHIKDSRRVATLTAYIISVCISLPAVIMRFVSRRIARTKYGADDWIILAALVLILSFSTIRPVILIQVVLGSSSCGQYFRFTRYAQVSFEATSLILWHPPK